ncbi:MAG: ABC transporter ATP-binding protein [Deltaproteobacteria bacterium]|nr:ABC transporter ATP-binding protein [Deltaproteobacteria bacterium]
MITVDGVSKRYTIGKKESYGSLRDEVMDALSSPFRRLFGGSESSSDPSVWALKDVSFEVSEGDVLGIIGRNGAGKSTLLKILSRITEPTEGRIEMRGRIASLLEVGTGFHPELTGRENIFMNGALLGMSSREIKAKFDEIVAFSEIEKFLDTPVKRYSSGMYVRLAFAVAAHLEPEILVIDEVLAVGDTLFQKKCVDKMLEVSKKGRTVLFVSHNLTAVKALCKSAILLREGKLFFKGGAQEVIDAYSEVTGISDKVVDLSKIERKEGTNDLIFDQLTFCDYPIAFGKQIKFKLRLKSKAKAFFPELELGVAIVDRNNNTMIHCSNRFLNKLIEHTTDADEYLFEIENNLRPGIYFLTLFLKTKDKIQDWLLNVVMFEIGEGNPYNFTDTTQIRGAIFPAFNVSTPTFKAETT